VPNQLEGRSVKGQVKALGLVEIAKQSVNVLEVNGIAEGDKGEVIGQVKTVFGLNEKDLVLGVHNVCSNSFQSLLYFNVLFFPSKPSTSSRTSFVCMTVKNRKGIDHAMLNPRVESISILTTLMPHTSPPMKKLTLRPGMRITT